MAKFDPETPYQTPSSYLGLSKPITPYDGDKSGLYKGEAAGAAAAAEGRQSEMEGKQLAGLGNIFTSAVSGLDTIVKGIIDDAVYKGVDKQREGFTGALEAVGNVPQNQRIADYSPEASTPSSGSVGKQLEIFGPPDPSQPMPTAVASVDRTATDLQTGAGSGKFNKLYYEGRLDLLAKDLRNNYPGYRDYIDSKISTVTGGNPANEYMKVLLTQINESQTGAKSEREHSEAFIRANAGIPGAAEAIQKVQSGQWSQSDVIKWAAPIKKAELDMNLRKAVREDNKGGREELAAISEQDLVKLSNDTVNNSWNTILDLGPMGKMSASDIETKVKDGTLITNSEDQLRLQYVLQVGKANVEKAIRAQASIADKNGNSLIRDVDPSKSDKRISEALYRYDAVNTLIGNKDYGTAFRTANAAKVIGSDEAYKILNAKDPTVQAYVRAVTGMNAAGGPNAGAIVFQSASQQGLAPGISTYLDQRRAQIVGQPDAKADNPNPKVWTLTGAVQEMLGAKVGVPPADDPTNPIKRSERAAYSVIMDLPSKIADPDLGDAAKIGIVKGSFGTQNLSLLNHFDEDKVLSSRDPVTGQLQETTVPGRQTLFRNMTSPAITAEIYRLGQKDSEVWNQYRVWTEKTFGNVLFGEDIRNLNGFGDTPNVKISYDNENFRFHADYVPEKRSGSLFAGSMMPGPSQMQVEQINDRLEKLNGGLGNMSNVAKAMNADANVYLYKQMVAQGLDPKANFIPSKMMDAVIKANSPVEAIDPFGNKKLDKNQDRVK